MPDLPDKPPLYDWHGHLVEAYVWHGPAEFRTADGYHVTVDDGEAVVEVGLIEITRSFAVPVDVFDDHATPINLEAIRGDRDR